ncbi:MAG: hypothetical protein ABI241_00385, partial [Bacteroidia bacterium]
PFKEGDFAIDIGCIDIYIVGYDNFKKSNKESDMPEWYNDRTYTHPNPSQILTYLISEFWKRFKVGDNIKSVVNENIIITLTEKCIFKLSKENDLRLFKSESDGITVFKHKTVTWATKVEEGKRFNLFKKPFKVTIIPEEKPLTNEEIIKLRKLIKLIK